MKTSNENSWIHAIRRYVYEVIILLGIFTLIAVGYRVWYQSSTDKIRFIVNDYHLTSTFHYLKAMKELRGLQYLLKDELVKVPNQAALQTKITALRHDDNRSILFHLIQREIQAGLKLHSTVADNRFDALALKLEQKNKNYQASNEAYSQKKSSYEQLINDIKALLTSLDQMVRLHSIIRDERLIELKALENRQTLIYYILLCALLLAGLLITRLGLRAIKTVIVEHQAAEKKIRHQAHFDDLTNLPNRPLSLDRLSQQINDARRNKHHVALLFLDLDDFKKVNDSLGHNIGDKLLAEAAARLKTAVRDSDTVGRLGGDEFIAILGKLTNLTDVRSIADNLINQVRTVFGIDGHELLLTASIGISIYPEDGDNALELLRNADSAMYHSKKLGRNTYSYFTDSMNREASRRLALEKEIHNALERREFNVVYQPKVDIASGKIMGAEALLRWHNPTLGHVSPDEFIPIAEQTGLIVPIGQFVLNEALSIIPRCHKENNVDFHMAVNLSPRQFRDPHLVSSIEKTLQRHGISSKLLELEITEGVLMSGHAYIDNALAELSSLGVSLAMDDFGTGYSSLSYLRSYPFNVLKIDRSFIHDITTDSANRELINAAISMGHSLSLKVVAEGVETEEELAYLQQLSCDYAQGYLFGKPVPEDKIIEIFESGISEWVSG